MTNDPDNPEVTLHLKADLVVLFAANNPRIYFGQLKRNTTISKPIEFTGEKLSDIKITGMKLEDENEDAFTFKLKDKRQSGDDIMVIDAELDTGKIDPGRFNHKLIVTTDNEEIGETTVLLSGEILGPLSANPRRLYFVNYTPEERMEREVRVSSPEGLEFKILDAKVPDKDIQVVDFSKVENGEHIITLSLNAPKDRNRVKTDLVVETDLKDQSTLTVPIYAYEKRTRPGPSKSRPDKGDEDRKTIRRGGPERFEKGKVDRDSLTK